MPNVDIPSRPLALLRIARLALAPLPNVLASLPGGPDQPGLRVRVQLPICRDNSERLRRVTDALDRVGLVLAGPGCASLRNFDFVPITGDDAQAAAVAHGLEDGLFLVGVVSGTLGWDPTSGVPDPLPPIRGDGDAHVCLVDGQHLSPSWRALSGGAAVDGLDSVGASEHYTFTLDAITDLIGLHWDDGRLLAGSDDDDDQGDDPDAPLCGCGGRHWSCPGPDQADRAGSDDQADEQDCPECGGALEPGGNGHAAECPHRGDPCWQRGVRAVGVVHGPADVRPQGGPVLPDAYRVVPVWIAVDWATSCGPVRYFARTSQGDQATRMDDARRQLRDAIDSEPPAYADQFTPRLAPVCDGEGWAVWLGGQLLGVHLGAGGSLVTLIRANVDPQTLADACMAMVALVANAHGHA